MANTVRKSVQVVGKVQGVWFRKYTQEAAQKRGLSGWVRNASDGSVRCEVEGPSDVVAAFLTWCHEGSPLSRVDHVITQTMDIEGSTDFVILR